jgi:PAS domain S-box-containing protein
MPQRIDDTALLVEMVDHAPTTLLVVDDELRVRWANRTTVDTFGYELDEVLGRNVLDFLDPDWDPIAFESVATAMGTVGVRMPMLFRCIRKDGTKAVIEAWANSQMEHPVLQGLVVAVRRWDERYLLDRALEAMAASKPLSETLRLLVDIAEAETLEAHAAILYDRMADRFGGVVASTGLIPELCGPTLGQPEEVVAAWQPFMAQRDGGVHDITNLPPLLGERAAAAGYRSLWVWPSTPGDHQPASAAAVAWRREPYVTTDQTREQGVARLARVAGLVVERVRSEERTLMAVLFTDIVDSTASAARIGDAAWRSVLEQHDAIVRRELGRFQGIEVKQLGDGFLATFDGPARAIDCALAITRATQNLGIQVRAGVHVGEVDRRGTDVAGISVHIGARIAALAGPSEVLVSRTARDVVAGAGFSLVDRGEHGLKGIPDPWQVYLAARP